MQIVISNILQCAKWLQSETSPKVRVGTVGDPGEGTSDDETDGCIVKLIRLYDYFNSCIIVLSFSP